MPIAGQKIKHACDQCRLRKLKCDGGQPCPRCDRMQFRCTFERVHQQRKTNSRRIDLIRGQQGTPPLSPPDSQASPTRSSDVVSTPVLRQRTQSTSSVLPASSHIRNTSSVWPSDVDEDDVFRYIEIYFDRMFLTLPIIDRRRIYSDIAHRRHHEDPDVAIILLSISAFALVQPVCDGEHESIEHRKSEAKRLLNIAARLRTFDFGERMCTAGIISSFFAFAALLGLGLHNAGWLKLRESVEYARSLGLYRPEAYHGLIAEESIRRFRVLLLLSVTERGYALQRNKDISFRGQNIGYYHELAVFVKDLAETQPHLLIRITDAQSEAFEAGLLQLMNIFDSVDEEVIPCLNRSCAPSLQHCQKLSIAKVTMVHNAIVYALPGSQPCSRPILSSPPAPLTMLQWADCYALQQWLLVRLWVACLTHDMLEDSGVLSFMSHSYAIDIATNMLEWCDRMDRKTLEAHGTGMIERVFDIAMAVIMVIQAAHGAPSEAHKKVLHGYFALLERLRGGQHPFTAALRDAERSIR
jgi:hypothetical protein